MDKVYVLEIKLWNDDLCGKTEMWGKCYKNNFGLACEIRDYILGNHKYFAEQYKEGDHSFEIQDVEIKELEVV